MPRIAEAADRGCRLREPSEKASPETAPKVTNRLRAMLGDARVEILLREVAGPTVFGVPVDTMGAEDLRIALSTVMREMRDYQRSRRIDGPYAP